jgi:TonB family protein
MALKQVAHMEYPHTPFQRSLAVSLGIHVLIFGSALAFAQYTGFLSNEGMVISVSLVTEGRTGGAVRRPDREKASPMPVNTMPPALPMSETVSDTADEAQTGESGPAMSGSVEAGPAAAGQGEGAGSTAVSGTDGLAGTLSPEQWRQLHSALEQAKTYPRLARERGIEGTVLVRFKVLPSGAVETVNIVRSSGASILDDASVKTVYRAGPMPFVNGWVEVPMSYVLK